MSTENLNPHNVRPLTPAASQGGPTSVRLPADRSQYPAAAYARGEDIFVPVCVATAFGGPMDRGDDGRTASGILTSRPGGVVGCALPMPAARGCRGTPFPQMPWKTLVRVSWGGGTADLELIDEGPTGGLKSQAMIDITLEGWEAIMGKKLPPSTVNDLQKMVSFWIPGGMRFMGDYRPWGVYDDVA